MIDLDAIGRDLDVAYRRRVRRVTRQRRIVRSAAIASALALVLSAVAMASGIGPDLQRGADRPRDAALLVRARDLRRRDEVDPRRRRSGGTARAPCRGPEYAGERARFVYARVEPKRLLMPGARG